MLLALGAMVGVLAAAVQFLGVIRWPVLVGVAMLQSTELHSLVGVAGMVIGAILAVCSLEFVGSFELNGWKLAGIVTPFAYIAWSIWLVATGVALLL